MSVSRLQSQKKQFYRLFFTIVLGLSLAIAALFYLTKFPPLQVENFSWSGQKIGVNDPYFSLTFNRRVNRSSISKNLVINPSLPGKISWVGNRLFYTLSELPIYGNSYELRLQDESQNLQPFLANFNSHDRAFVYIGVQEQERGKLILCNILTPEPERTELQKTILTPSDLTVTDFAIYPEGDKILFAAIPAGPPSSRSLPQELYTVTTGLNLKNQLKPTRAGRVQKFLEAQTYQNLKFVLASRQPTVVVWRVNYNNPGDASLWVIPEGGEARPLGIQGENFRLSPDGHILGVEQSGGVALIPLRENGQVAQFLTDYEKILGFSADSSAALMVKRNSNNTRSLYWVKENGQTEFLANSAQPLLDCQLEPRREQTLYCLKTDLVLDANAQLQEEPFLAMIELNRQQDIPLIALPNYRDVQISMSPDGVALLFDQVVTTSANSRHNLMTASGKTIADGRLWLLPLPDYPPGETSAPIIPKELNPGFKPRWLP